MPKSSVWPIVGIVCGVLLMLLAPLVSILGTVVGMIGSFQKVAAANGPPDPQLMADGMGMALVSTVTGVALFPAGLVLLVFSMIWLARNRRAAREAQVWEAAP